MSEGVDYSSGRPGGAALAAAGKTFACRYLAYRGNPTPLKALSPGEIEDLHNHGVAVVATFESTSNRALDGAIAGEADATDALAALKGLGFPPNCPVYFAVDFDAQPQHQARIDAYLTAAAAVLGRARIGVYGGINLLTRCRQNGTAIWFWQTRAWSGISVASFAHLYQRQNSQSINGAAVDLDTALKASFGQWDAPGGAGPEQPIGGDVIYSRGGLKTAIVKDGTPYASVEAGPTVGHTTGDHRYLCAAYGKNPQWVAIDGNYAGAQGATGVPMGWVTTAALSDVQDAIPAPVVCPPPPSAISAVIAFSDGSKQQIGG